MVVSETVARSRLHFRFDAEDARWLHQHDVDQQYESGDILVGAAAESQDWICAVHRNQGCVLGRLGPGQTRWSSCPRISPPRPDHMKFEFVPWTNFRRPLAQRAEFQGQALRPDHRRQPVDRRLGRERPLRQAQRLLRQGRHQDGRLHAGDRRRLFRMAEEHAELLGAAGDGRRVGWTYRKDWFAKPELQKEFKAKYGRDLAAPKTWDRAEADRRVLPGPRDRRQEGLRRLDLHRARLRRHHHGRDQRALRLRLQSTRTRRSPTTWKASSTRPTR
jgi:hypothetical protein